MKCSKKPHKHNYSVVDFISFISIQVTTNRPKAAMRHTLFEPTLRTITVLQSDKISILLRYLFHSYRGINLRNRIWNMTEIQNPAV